MQRNVTKQLIEWKSKSNRKPLIVMGVRQCGKSFIIDSFGKNDYEDVATFNFEKQEALSEIFEIIFNNSLNRIMHICRKHAYMH